MSEDKSEAPGPEIREVNPGEQFALFPTPESLAEGWSEGPRETPDGKVVVIKPEFRVKGLGDFDVFINNYDSVEVHTENTGEEHSVLATANGPIKISGYTDLANFQKDYNDGKIVHLSSIKFPPNLYARGEIPTVKLLLPKLTVTFSEEGFSSDVFDDEPLFDDGVDENGEIIDNLYIPTSVVGQIKVEVTE